MERRVCGVHYVLRDLWEKTGGGFITSHASYVPLTPNDTDDPSYVAAVDAIAQDLAMDLYHESKWYSEGGDRVYINGVQFKNTAIESDPDLKANLPLLLRDHILSLKLGAGNYHETFGVHVFYNKSRVRTWVVHVEHGEYLLIDLAPRSETM